MSALELGQDTLYTRPLDRSEFPRFSLAERDRRWGRIRERMREEGIDCLLIHGDSGKWDQKAANMRYVGHIGGNGEDGWLVFPLDGDPTALIFSGGSMAMLWHELQDWTTDIRNVPLLRWSNALCDRITELGLQTGTLGLVGLTSYQESEGTASYSTVTRVRERFPGARFTDAGNLIESLRLYKSPEELTFVEQATAIGDRAVPVLRRAARPGVSEVEAYAKMYEALLLEGSEQPLMFFWDAGTQVSHAQRYPGRRILQRGDTIVTEISPRYFGYWGHVQAPVAVGGATPEYQCLYDIAYESCQAAMQVFRPGARLRDVSAAFAAPIIEAGMTSLHPYAHGTGGRGSEFPLLHPPTRRQNMPPESVAHHERLMNIEVKEGMVLAFEPHVTQDRVHGVHLGDPVVATATGNRRLSTLDLREWESAGSA